MSVVIFLLQFIVAIILLPLHILNFLGLWDSFIKKLFPYFLSRFCVSYNKLMDNEKRKLFSNISDFARPSKELWLLEIGCGTGPNFKFYPRGSKVTCLDINPNFQKFLTKSQAENDHLIYERFVVASADNMTSVGDGSMDVVVCTLLACSVPNVPAVLKEIQRVLRPMQLNRVVDVREVKLRIATREIKEMPGGELHHNSRLSLRNTPLMSQVLLKTTDIVSVTSRVKNRSSIVVEGIQDHVRSQGGVFYFIEHVADNNDSTWICFFQKVLNPSWKIVFDGCSIRKTTWKDLENAKFSELNLRHITAPTSMKLINPHIIGYAVK